jgi:phosphatidylinositol glycan class P protein
MSESQSVYAFVGYIVTILGYVIFWLWALVPDAVLKDIGITYYPSRYYAIALPAYFMVLYVLSGCVYMAINMIKTHPNDSIYTILDEHSKRAPTLAEQLANTRSIPEIGDSDLRYISFMYASSSLDE